MKFNKSALLAFGLLILAASLYRALPDRPWGFAPQWAMAIFAGAVVADKKWAFALPLISMFLSDAIYQLLYQNGVGTIWGFYEGQFTNYILFTSMTVFGLMIRRISWVKIMAASLAAPSAFFLLSNLMVWIGGGGLERPKTFAGLMQCYADGILFFKGSLEATPLFCLFFFGTYFLMRNRSLQPRVSVV